MLSKDMCINVCLQCQLCQRARDAPVDMPEPSLYIPGVACLAAVQRLMLLQPHVRWHQVTRCDTHLISSLVTRCGRTGGTQQTKLCHTSCCSTRMQESPQTCYT